MTYYSIHFNRPDFVEIQYNLSKKIGYDLVIVNNGRNKSIKEISKKLGVNYMETDNIGKNSMSHANSINQILPLINMQDDWGLLDHDMFITTKVEFNNNDIISVKCTNVSDKPYMWPGMLICKEGVNLSNIDFSPGVGIHGDTGCGTYKVVSDYKVKWCKLSYKGEQDQQYIQDSKIITAHILDDEVIGYHYLNGSNWTNGVGADNKNKILIDILDNIKL